MTPEITEAHCSVAGCCKPRLARGLCGAHYRRLGLHGSAVPEKPLRVPPGTLNTWLKNAVNHVSDECLIWPFAKSKGYGRMRLGGKSFAAHRTICILAHGEPPDPLHHAAHSCGNRGCVNPKHLRWATPKENQTDMVNHGRSQRGEKNCSSKLSASDVRLIRDCLASGDSPRSIARQFSITQTTVRRIATRLVWGWLE